MTVGSALKACCPQSLIAHPVPKILPPVVSSHERINTTGTAVARYDYLDVALQLLLLGTPEDVTTYLAAAQLFACE